MDEWLLIKFKENVSDAQAILTAAMIEQGVDNLVYSNGKNIHVYGMWNLQYEEPIKYLNLQLSYFVKTLSNDFELESSIVYSINKKERLDYSIKIERNKERKLPSLPSLSIEFYVTNHILSFDFEVTNEKIDELITVYCKETGLHKKGRKIFK